MDRRLLRQELSSLAWVAAGAMPGALLRWHWSGGWSGTLAANLLGALILGALVPLNHQHPRLLLLAGIGFCGSLTTFSTWMLELMDALERDQPQQAMVLLATHLLGGLIAVVLGSGLSSLAIRRWASRRPGPRDFTSVRPDKSGR